MNPTLRIAGCVLLIGGGVALASLTIGCERPVSQRAVAALPTRPADAVYTTRAKVESLPIAGKPATDFVVFHEPIDTFVDPRSGKTVGMNSMSMPFSNLAQGVTLNGLAVGDVVEMTFGVWYKPDPTDASKKVIDTFAVQKLGKLPAETNLKFGKASPPLGKK